MKGKIIILILISLVTMAPAIAQDHTVSARIISASDSIAVGFATVKLMQPDSTMMAATYTDEKGCFYFDTPLTPGMYLMISSIGSKSIGVTLPCDSIICVENSNELREVVVNGSRKYVKITPRGLKISMEGNPMAKLGNAMEALKQLPMIDASGGGISVLGQGSPVIYINNRLVRSANELSMLSTEEISNVEIITNPSAKYGADVTSVILIHTKKLNNGLHTVAAGSVEASEEWSESGDLTVEYHKENGLTVFGNFSYGFSGFKQHRYYKEAFSTENNPYIQFQTNTYIRAKNKNQSLMADGGLNFDFGKNSAGIKYTFRRTPKYHFTNYAESTTDCRPKDEYINSMGGLNRQTSMHHINTFGSFLLPGNTELRIDADHVSTSNHSKSGVNENNSASVVLNSTTSDGGLWSGRLVLSRKVHSVETEAGTEISYTHNRQNYTGTSSDNLDFINPETDDVKQNLFAGFASFDWTPNNMWNIYGGMRIETTTTDYKQNGIAREDLSRTYTDLLPNLGISFYSQIRMTLFYRGSIARPGYQSLDNTYVYVTPTLWETGNPELLATLRHRIGVNMSYKKLIIQSSLTMNHRNVASVYHYNHADRINVVRPINLPNYNSFQLVAVQQLDFGFWHPMLQGVMYVQTLKYGNPIRKYWKPLYTLSLNNRFDLPGGIYAYLNVYGLGTGNQDVIYSRGAWQASITLNKSWKNWTFTLFANDLFNTWRQRFDTITNGIEYSSNIKGGSRSISLSLRYELNKAKGKYKGKTSRQDEIDRL